MLWVILSWLLLLLAFAVGARAIIWDRPGFRGRPALRCRGCWYDLSAAAGAETPSKEKPVTCPECGRRHPSRRSMRKTRRPTRWILATLALWALSYSAGVTPQIQRNGWGSAVPRVVIVASLPFLSDESGPALPRQFVPDMPFLATGYEAWVLEQARHSAFGVTQGQPSPYGWVSRRLLFALARLQPVETITDGSSVRGAVAKSAITQIVLAGEAYGFEEGWAEGVAYAEGEGAGTFAPGQMVHGRLRVRRLLFGFYELSDQYSGTRYRCFSQNPYVSVGGLSRGPMLGGADPNAKQYWIDRVKWDNCVPMNGGSHDVWAIPLGSAGNATDGPATIGTPLWFSEHTPGTPNPLPRTPPHRIDAITTYTADAGAALAEDSSNQLRAWIEAYLVAKLTVAYHHDREEWVPVVKFASRSTGPTVPAEVLLIGGTPVIMEIQTIEGRPYERRLLTSTDRTSWSWRLRAPDPEAMDPVDPDQPWFTHTITGLVARSEIVGGVPGHVQRRSFLPQRSPNPKRYVLRIEPRGSASFAGFRGDLAYTGPLEFPLEDWAEDELRAFIVSGTVPEHAMP